MADRGISRGDARMVGVVFLLVATPIFAELISTYLTSSGDLLAALGTVAFLAPLYGGAALAIREVTVRQGTGWRARFLLAASFGVLMPTLVDGSLFTATNADVENWDEIVTTTQVGGISVYAVVAWVVGHIVISIAAPIALAEALVASRRIEPWVSIPALVVIGLLGFIVAMLIHFDASTERADPIQAVASAAIVLGLAAAGLSRRWRRHGPRTPQRMRLHPLVVAAAGFVLMLSFDLAPVDWFGVTVMGCVAVVAGVLAARSAAATDWGWQRSAALAYGAVLARTLIGFLVSVPEGVAPSAKYLQNAACLALVAALGIALRRQMRAEPLPPGTGAISGSVTPP
jgi:cytochrome bd-type quinol oxidase subunit 2